MQIMRSNTLATRRNQDYLTTQEKRRVFNKSLRRKYVNCRELVNKLANFLP